METITKHLVKNPRCFCKVPLTDLEKWAHKKYIEGKNTLQLLQEARSEYDKELITIIAMFDVDSKTMNKMLGHQTKPSCNLEMCRSHVHEWLENIVEDRQKHL
jgi:hypothetical protein